jgi:hypothetical protein
VGGEISVQANRKRGDDGVGACKNRCGEQRAALVVQDSVASVSQRARRKNYVASYASMHPAEDWAKTVAHYLHIRDTLDTSAAFGFTASSVTFERRMLGPNGFDTMIEMWLPLAWALNVVNRSMGRDDLYPFVLPEPVLEKMRFIDTTIDEITSNRQAGLGRRRVAWTAMAEPMHLGSPTGAASGRRRFQYVAKAACARVTMEAGAPNV